MILPSAFAPEPRNVRPLWFSKPTNVRGVRPMSVCTTTSPMNRFLPASAQFHHARLESVPLRALEQREDVAPITVDVHEVGVEPADRQFLCHVSQYGDAHPRLTSSALRSSIAV